MLETALTLPVKRVAMTIPAPSEGRSATLADSKAVSAEAQDACEGAAQDTSDGGPDCSGPRRLVHPNSLLIDPRCLWLHLMAHANW